MHPIILQCGPITVFSYGLMVALAFLIGTFLAQREAKLQGISSEEIINITPKNRKISHPFLKSMVSSLYIDQSAAVIMTSEKIARELGIDEDLWIYPMGGADLENIWFLSRREQFHTSPAIGECSKLVLKQAGLDLSDINK